MEQDTSLETLVKRYTDSRRNASDELKDPPPPPEDEGQGVCSSGTLMMTPEAVC